MSRNSTGNDIVADLKMVFAMYRKTAYHEAGHAVAATMRGGAEAVRSIYIDWDQAGHGMTWHRSKVCDNPFIAYAGAWAEVRLEVAELNPDDLSPSVPMGSVDEVLHFQPDDARLLTDTYFPVEGWGWESKRGVWHMELEREWAVITAVAERLWEDQDVNADFIAGELEAPTLTAHDLRRSARVLTDGPNKEKMK